MMLQPLARKGGGSLPAVAQSYSTPAPIGGWNARDSVANMPESDAVVLKNWVPGSSRVSVRRGFESYFTGFSDPVETLMTYASGTKEEFFAAVGGEIHDISSSGTMGSAKVSSLTNDRWQYVNMGTSGGNFLIAVNGEDTPIKYDGSTWGTSAITGVTSTDLIDVAMFKRRLFFVVRESLTFAFLPTYSISGAASTFDLAPICKLGGYLMSIGTWTRDGGDGLDDFIVFYTSRGEVVIYQGSDPTDATDWSLVGVFQIGAPIGRRCMIKAGSDLVLLSQDGFIPLSSSLAAGRVTTRVAISDKIRDAVNDAVRNYGDNFGWQGILYPKGRMAIFNVPIVEGTQSEQYVANTNTGVWCQFTDMNANCWGIFNGDLYFGGDSAVFLADSGFDDDGNNIKTDVQQAPTYLRSRNSQKAFRRIRPVLTTDGAVTPAISVNVDFELRNPPVAPTITPIAGAVWDVAPWDLSSWTVGPSISKDWIAVEGVGRAAAIRMRLESNGFEVAWNATDWLFELGGVG